MVPVVGDVGFRTLGSSLKANLSQRSNPHNVLETKNRHATEGSGGLRAFQADFVNASSPEREPAIPVIDLHCSVSITRALNGGSDKGVGIQMDSLTRPLIVVTVV